MLDDIIKNIYKKDKFISIFNFLFLLYDSVVKTISIDVIIHGDLNMYYLAVFSVYCRIAVPHR